MNIKTVGFLLLIMATFASCRKKDVPEEPKVPEFADLNFRFNTTFGSDRVLEGSEQYTNYHGETFSFNLLKYYVTKIVLVKDDGEEYETNIYKLVDAFNEDFQSAKVEDVANGHYNKIKFYFGVPDPENTEAHYEGDLNISYGMAWTWSFGYIFYKHEGTFSDGSASNQPLSYHLGTAGARNLVELPLNLTLEGAEKTVNINLDMEKVYNQSDVYELSNHALIHSTSSDDRPWVTLMGRNISNSFSVN